MKISLPSRVDKVKFRGRSLYVKRDDLLHSCLSGNKYRKLYTLTQLPSTHCTKVISYGGSQSNAMLAIACLCQAKGWAFHYYTKTVASYLKQSPEGNFKEALNKGMILHEISHELYEDKLVQLKQNQEAKTLLISQGGADSVAREGIRLLAEEINSFKQQQGIEKLSVVLPSGTGSTSLFLKEFVEQGIEVYTVVLVGDEAFQLAQWKRLSSGPYPKILPMPKKKFAKAYVEYLQMYEALKAQTGIEFDLIYAPKTWMGLCEHLLELDSELIYIHTGGVSGNSSMLKRYTYKGRR